MLASADGRRGGWRGELLGTDFSEPERGRGSFLTAGSSQHRELSASLQNPAETLSLRPSSSHERLAPRIHASNSVSAASVSCSQCNLTWRWKTHRKLLCRSGKHSADGYVLVASRARSCRLLARPITRLPAVRTPGPPSSAALRRQACRASEDADDCAVRENVVKRLLSAGAAPITRAAQCTVAGR